MENKLILLFLTAMLVAGIVSAIPGVPHQFYGTVTVNGQPVNNNLLKAVSEGDEYFSIVLDGKYGFNPNIFYVEDPDGDRNGQTVVFYLGGKRVFPDTTFQNNALTEFNVATTTTCGDGYCIGGETCSECTADCGICTDPPAITIVSPIQTTYYSLKVPLEVSADQTILVWMYSLNGGSLEQFTPNITITALEGENDLTVLALNNVFVTGTNTVSFTVDPSYCGNGVCDTDKGRILLKLQ
ncbi:MAG: hypothetical protein ABIE22_04115 [archaeon]